jgi:uncharacterized membrane protein
LNARERPEKDARGWKKPQSEKFMTRKTVTFAFGSALALAALSIASADRQASAQNFAAPDCRGYPVGSRGRINCDARLGEWMRQRNQAIKREGARGGCGDRCQNLMNDRNDKVKGFKSHID